jgi:hypothetical protein
MHIVKSAKLHTTVFIGKTNLQMDLDPAKRSGMRLMADDEAEMLYVEYKGEVGRVPYTNLVSMIPADQQKFGGIFAEEYNKLTAYLSGQSVSDIHSALQSDSAANSPAAQSVASPANPFPRKPGRPPTNAQASTPQGHVHAGPGAGKTHD